MLLVVDVCLQSTASLHAPNTCTASTRACSTVREASSQFSNLKLSAACKMSPGILCYHATTLDRWGQGQLQAHPLQVIVHEADRQWLMREDTDKRVRWFSGESTAVTSTATMHCLGGHFRGSSILHVQGQAPGSSFICTGDTIMVRQICHCDCSRLLFCCVTRQGNVSHRSAAPHVRRRHLRGNCCSQPY